MNSSYPKHLFDKTRHQVATGYIKHELRKLLWQIRVTIWENLDKNINLWVKSERLGSPRDFWNGFHGMCMGFKLKIGMTNFITAENVGGERKKMPLEDIFFGVDLIQTRVMAPGRPPAKDLKDFYFRPENKKERVKQAEFTRKILGGTATRHDQPIIVVQKIGENGKLIYSTYDGNGRLALAVLEGRDSIDAYVGSYSSGDQPENYWIPTTILIENVFYAREAWRSGNEKVFHLYMEVLKDLIKKSDSARYELRERAILGPPEFSEKVIKTIFKD